MPETKRNRTNSTGSGSVAKTSVKNGDYSGNEYDWYDNSWSNNSWKSNDWWGPPSEKNYDFRPEEVLHCKPPHKPIEMIDVLTKEDMTTLREVWGAYCDNLDCPRLTAKPILSCEHMQNYHRIVLKVVQRIADIKQVPLSLDQATISATSAVGHKRHADNLVFGVWRYGYRVPGPVDRELSEARKDGAEIWWKPNTTCHRNYAASLNLVDPSEFQGGEVSFFRTLGAVEPYATYKAQAGSGIVFCGCDECMHEVSGVTGGFRLCLLVWTRDAGIITPAKSKTTHYHRPGTGDAVWLTLADLEESLQDIVVQPCPL